MTEFNPFAGAFQIAADIRAKKITARDTLEAYLERVERYNPDLNAIIFSDPEGARRRADDLDTMAARDEWAGPLHGVPMTIKESYNITGMPTTWGVPSLKDNYSDSNALSVDRLNAAGVNLFGKTNVPLLLSDWQSFNDIYGVTNHPWDLALSPGGSSGGSAAALAAGMSGLDAGSDIGASIRNPAHFCGIFGHKPSYGVISPRGHAMPGALTYADISVVGPLARTAKDLAIALDAMAGPDEIDGVGWRLELPRPKKTRLSDFKIGVMLSEPGSTVDREMTDVLQALVDKIAQAGATISDSARPDIDLYRAHELYVLLLRAATSSRMKPADIEAQQSKATALDASDDSYYARMLRGNTMGHSQWLQLNNERAHLRQRWAEYFEDYDLLLCPVGASAAQPHDHEGERWERMVTVNNERVLTTDQLFWAGISGVVYLPASVAPAGLTRSGLPVGIQIIGPYLHDHTCIEFARLIEENFGGFVPPPGYDS
ncbi:MAG: amidase [Alphaproteobacteria bacterium]|nr:amidase [Alphaproteobacteria bacterium]